MADKNRATDADGKSYDTDEDKDDIVDQNGGGLKPLSVGSSESSSSSGYFSNVLPPAVLVSDGMRNNSPQSDLYQSLNIHRGNDGHFGHGQRASSGLKAQGSPSERHNKDGETGGNEPLECTYCGVNYGGRDFYTSSSTEPSENNQNNNTNEGDEYGDPHVANRGEWWQGKPESKKTYNAAFLVMELRSGSFYRHRLKGDPSI